VSECDREASIMGRPWPAGGCCAMGIKICVLGPKLNKVTKHMKFARNAIFVVCLDQCGLVKVDFISF
jgi:hypothetical protein